MGYYTFPSSLGLKTKKQNNTTNGLPTSTHIYEKSHRFWALHQRLGILYASRRGEVVLCFNFPCANPGGAMTRSTSSDTIPYTTSFTGTL